jgi:sigma54-dependent transcription regulator
LEKGAQATAEWWYLKAALQDHQGAIERLEEIDELMVYGVVAQQKREIAEIKSCWEARCADLEAMMEHDFAELEARLRDGGIKAISLFDVVSDKDQEFISYVGPEE